MRTSFIIKTIISTLLAFFEMTKFLFDKYGDMVLAGKHYNSGVEAGMSDAFIWFLVALVLGIVIWTASMLLLSLVERLLDNRAKQKRKAKEADNDEEVFHD